MPNRLFARGRIFAYVGFFPVVCLQLVGAVLFGDSFFTLLPAWLQGWGYHKQRTFKVLRASPPLASVGCAHAKSFVSGENDLARCKGQSFSMYRTDLADGTRFTFLRKRILLL